VIARPDTLNRASLLSGVRTLARRDRGLARLVARYGPPPLWARRPGFTTLLRIILEQQVTLASAEALYRRLVGAVRPFGPAGILALGTSGLQGLGLTRQKARYAHALADRVTNGGLALRRLGRCSDAEARERLMEVPGIGPWTSSIYLLMALRRPDVWPPGDLALLKAMARLHGSTSTLTAVEVEQVTTRWRPLRAVAARILWHAYLAERAHARPGADGSTPVVVGEHCVGQTRTGGSPNRARPT
jgi:DNA-3-methyladenine glycosylase II